MALRVTPFGATSSAVARTSEFAAARVAQNGVTLNATGTYGMAYPSFLHMVGADKDPAKAEAVGNAMPIHRLIQPEDAANMVAALIDGRATGMTGQFFSIDGGWSVM